MDPIYCSCLYAQSTVSAFMQPLRFFFFVFFFSSIHQFICNNFFFFTYNLPSQSTLFSVFTASFFFFLFVREHFHFVLLHRLTSECLSGRFPKVETKNRTQRKENQLAQTRCPLFFPATRHFYLSISMVFIHCLWLAKSLFCSLLCEFDANKNEKNNNEIIMTQNHMELHCVQVNGTEFGKQKSVFQFAHIDSERTN